MGSRSLAWIALICAAACGGPQEPPHLCFRPAEPLALPGLVDSNSPVDWHAGKLRVFHGSSSNNYTDGTSLLTVGKSTEVASFAYRGGAAWPPTLWLEATIRKPKPNDARLYGIYHSEWDRLGEPRCGAAGWDPKYNLGVPKIGAMYSDDDGATWTNLGLLLEPPEDDKNCAAENGDFASGNGDPDVALTGDSLYIYYGNYGGPAATQGVSVARLLLADLDAPGGKARKWDGHGFAAPGLGGASVPIARAFVARVPYDGHVDSFWGPSIHHNTTLHSWVMLLNRTRYDGPYYGQEGAYVSFSDDPAKPGSWSTPIKFSYSGDSRFYPEMIGTASGDTDKRIGASGRYFESGESKWSVEFYRGALPAGCLGIID